MAWISTPTGWVDVDVPGFDPGSGSRPPVPPAGSPGGGVLAYPDAVQCPAGSHLDAAAGGCVSDTAVGGPPSAPTSGFPKTMAVIPSDQGKMLGDVRESVARAAAGEMSDVVLGRYEGTGEFPKVQYQAFRERRF